MATPGISSLPEPPDGDRNKGAATIIVGTIFGSLGLVLVSMRLWVRARIIKKLGSDDLFILICMIAVLVMEGLEVKYGVGRHQYYLNLNPYLLEQESNAIAWVYIYLRDHIHRLCFVHEDLDMLILVTYLWHKESVEVGALLNYCFRHPNGLTCWHYGSFAVSPHSENVATLSAWHLLASGSRSRSWRLQWWWVSQTPLLSSGAEVADVR